MTKCIHCNQEIHNQENTAEKYRKKFCNSKCAASHNNKKRTKVDIILEDKQEYLKALMLDNTPATTIAKLLNVSYDTFKARHPAYKPPQKISTRSKASNRLSYYERLEQTKQNKRNNIFESISTTGICQQEFSKHNQKKWLKKYLIEQFGECCSQCSWAERNPVTNNVMIEIDHIDGNNTNNTIQNVRLLCPNCHSLTPTYRFIKRTEH